MALLLEERQEAFAQLGARPHWVIVRTASPVTPLALRRHTLVAVRELGSPRGGGWARRSEPNATRPAGPCRKATPLGGRSPPRRLVEPLGGDLVANLLQRPADQPRHVHLRDPDLLRDLRLREPVEEPQVQDLPFAVVEHPEPRLEHGAILRQLVLVLLDADRLHGVDLLVVAHRRPDRQ